MVFTTDTVYDLFKNVAFLFEKGFYNLICSYNAYENWNKELFNVFSTELSKISKLYIRMYEQGQPVSIKLLTQAITDFLSGIGKSECGAFRDIVGILPNGDVLACGAFIGCPNFYEYHLGSIFTEVNYELITKYIANSCADYLLCKNCAFLSRCHNKCFVCNKRCTGNIQKIPLSLCEINKICIKQADIILEHMIRSKNQAFYDEYSKFLY